MRSYLQENLKNVISDILLTNTAYDCMPINSLINTINKSISLFDAINILIQQNVQELLVWDAVEMKYIWMLTIVDAIRLIIYTIRYGGSSQAIDFRGFYQYQQYNGYDSHQNLSNSQGYAPTSKPFIPTTPKMLSEQQIQKMILQIKHKKLEDVIIEVAGSHDKIKKQEKNSVITQEDENDEMIEQSFENKEIHLSLFTSQKLRAVQSQIQTPLSSKLHKPYIRLKSVVKQAKLSFIILTMITEKIHRVIIEDVENSMIISILNFKDILLYLLRLTNESISGYNHTTIQHLLQNSQIKILKVENNKNLMEAFEQMVIVERSLYINVVNQENKFVGILFREDFKDIFLEWKLEYLWMTCQQFIQLKQKRHKGVVPEFRTFQYEETTKDIIWKIVMTKRNVIICLNQQGEILLAIGLMELFSLYVQ